VFFTKASSPNKPVYTLNHTIGTIPSPVNNERINKNINIRAKDSAVAIEKREEEEAAKKEADAKREAAQQEEIVFSDKHSLSEYIIGREIGKGAYAIVRIGTHIKTNRRVALKIYEKDKIKDIQRKKSVRREIRLMKRLNHPNIAQLYEAIETDDQVILVLEYISGGSTHGFLKSKP
jgi:serine/threonine protein kinase